MEQLVLFPLPNQQRPQPQPAPGNEEAIDTISGFQYRADYISEAEHERLLAQIDKQEWLKDLKRRVQHYGFKYDYKARKVNPDMHIGPLPDWLKELGQRLHKDRHISECADQVIVNEYEPGQGITSHIDCAPCFEDTIVSLSLGSGCVMNFTNKLNKTQKVKAWLAPRSIIILRGEARYKWLHGIAPRKSDEWAGHRYERQRRVSLTFRKVILG